ELPRQFWPAWRAAVRQTFERYLTATDDERPSVISMLLALPAALLPPRVGGSRRCLRELGDRLSDPENALAALIRKLSLGNGSSSGRSHGNDGSDGARNGTNSNG